MSKINLDVRTDMVIPTISSEVFMGHDEARFAIGMLATGNNVLPGRESELEGYLRLRANVYAFQTRMISPELVQEDGTETDEDDGRSVHWALFEQGFEKGTARVIGSIRTIIKTNDDPRPLPIEDFFPEVFTAPAPIGSVEVSRYIARHENKRVQRLLSEPLFNAVVGYVTSRELGPTFGVVEEAVERRLRLGAVPLRRIALPKYVPQYADDNLGIEVFIPEMARALGLDQVAPEALRATEQKLGYFTTDTRGARSTAA